MHEIAHVLGFGTLWDFGPRVLLAGDTASDPRFTGEEAVASFAAAGGSGLVPVEADGGEGTALGHWDEAIFDAELMTGFVEAPGVNQPLSRISIGSMADLGYEVDLAVADAGFSLGPPPAAAAAKPGSKTRLREIPVNGPIIMLSSEGGAALRRQP